MLKSDFGSRSFTSPDGDWGVLVSSSDKDSRPVMMVQMFTANRLEHLVKLLMVPVRDLHV